MSESRRLSYLGRCYPCPVMPVPAGAARTGNTAITAPKIRRMDGAWACNALDNRPLTGASAVW